jgi:hypothetical protein
MLRSDSASWLLPPLLDSEVGHRQPANLQVVLAPLAFLLPWDYFRVARQTGSNRKKVTGQTTSTVSLLIIQVDTSERVNFYCFPVS